MQELRLSEESPFLKQVQISFMSENGGSNSAVDGGGINASSINSFIICLMIKSNMTMSPFRYVIFN